MPTYKRDFSSKQEAKLKQAENLVEIAQDEYSKAVEAFNAAELKASYLLLIIAGIIATFTLSNMKASIDIGWVKVIHYTFISLFTIFQICSVILIVLFFKPQDLKKYSTAKLKKQPYFNNYAKRLEMITNAYIECTKSYKHTKEAKLHIFERMGIFTLLATITLIVDVLLLVLVSK
jgi:hypothetical protein